MTAKKKLVKELIRSLNEDWNDWEFTNYTAENKITGVEIWTHNIPILHLGLFKPFKLRFSLLDKIKIYMAINECKCLKVLTTNNLSK